MTVPQAMAPWHAGEWVFLLLSNVIIFYFCAPKILVDVRRWLGRKPQGS